MIGPSTHRTKQRWLRLLAPLATLTMLFATPAWSLTDRSFESGFGSWQTFGDVLIDDTSSTQVFGSAATQGNMQLMMSTLPNNPINQAGAPLGTRAPFSGTNSLGSAALEAAVGLPVGTLTGLSPSGNSAIQGSGIYQDFAAANATTVTFDWNMLTNEPTPTGTYTDFFFWALTPAGGGPVLQSGSVMDTSQGGAFGASTAVEMNEETGYATFNFNIATSGNYRLVLGVLDVQDDNYTSGVLIDNFTVVPEPGTGVLLLIGLSGLAISSRRYRT